MTTVVNNPAPATDEGGNSLLIGVIILVGFFIIFVYFGIPAIKRMGLNVPAPQVNVPSKIDVNVVQPK